MPIRSLVAAALATLLIPAGAGAQDADLMEDVRNFRIANEPSILEDTLDFLRLPNNAADRADILANAEHLVGLLEARGISAEILEAGDASPAVYGELIVPGAPRTLMIYAHYDGQPVQPEHWSSDPFSPLIRNGRLEDGAEDVPWPTSDPIDPDWRIYARSSSDDKSPIIAVLYAIDALRSAGRPLGVNLKFFLEGEEEAGSPHLRDLLETHRERLDADLWLMADGPIDTRGDPRMVLGVRGVTSVQLTIHGAERALHSGHYGNIAPNPAAQLAHLITSMRDPSGRVLIDGFYDEVTPVSDSARQFIAEGAFDEASLLDEPGIAETEFGPGSSYGEAVMMPALNILGLDSGAVGDATRNAVPASARAAIGFRVVPGMTLEHLRTVFGAHVAAQDYLVLDRAPTDEERRMHTRIVELHWEQAGYAAAGTPADNPLIQHLVSLMHGVSERPLRVVPLLGGSLPLAPISEVTGAPFAIVPMVNPDNAQHAPDENLRIGNLWDGIELYATLIASDWSTGEP